MYIDNLTYNFCRFAFLTLFHDVKRLTIQRQKSILFLDFTMMGRQDRQKTRYAYASLLTLRGSPSSWLASRKGNSIAIIPSNLVDIGLSLDHTDP